MHDCTKEASLTERQTDEILNDKNVWRDFVRSVLEANLNLGHATAHLEPYMAQC